MKLNLAAISTRAPTKLDKAKTKLRTAALCAQIGELQNLLYAEAKHAVLIVIQGMDASGKDGLVKRICQDINPSGVRVHPFKKPTDLEMAHDFLWRVHQVVPEKGIIQIFNRSHYEDILIQRVHEWIDEDTVQLRIKHINYFEQILKDNGTLILKFYLHISPEEQQIRFKERQEDITKKWKYNAQDGVESKLWKKYMLAYHDAITLCNQAAEWQIVPADQNWYKEYLVATRIVEELKALKMKFPNPII
jgi:PPK2 family polyphosphate:nucleotide phosphotransferase